MEEITKLMQLIDSNSDNIKEGNYLEMCNTIKILYNKIPTYRRVTPAAFMQVNPWAPMIMEEQATNARIITTRQKHIKLLEKYMKSLKYVKNITESVKVESVVFKARELGIDLEENTVHELRAAGVDIPNERDFYKEYIVNKNTEIADERTEVEQELTDCINHLVNIRRRQRWLVETYNL